MQSPNDIRPISTYDNLNATSGIHTSTPKFKNHSQHSQQTFNISKATEMDMETDTDADAERERDGDNNETSNSIAAVKAALNDAKSKFFGINNYETIAKNTQNPNNNNAQILAQSVKPIAAAEPKYQNVPQRAQKKYTKPDDDNNHVDVADDEQLPISPPPSIIQVMPEMDHHHHHQQSPSTPFRSLRYGTTTYEQIPLSDIDVPQPSQAVYMSTTVPQNIKAMKIAGRHTPTRNSLRHSRMIVVNNKTTDSVQDAYTTHKRQVNLTRCLLIFQFILGLVIIGLAIRMFMLAPNASILVNPYLSGLALLLASVAGLILMRWDKRKDYIIGSRATAAATTTQNNCYRILLTESYMFTILALVLCCLALVRAAIEFTIPTSGISLDACDSNSIYFNSTTESLETSTLTTTTTASSTVLEAQLNDDKSTTTTTTTNDSSSSSCEFIIMEWKYLLGISMALNTLGVISTFLYITLFVCCRRNRKHFFTTSSSII